MPVSEGAPLLLSTQLAERPQWGAQHWGTPGPAPSPQVAGGQADLHTAPGHLQVSEKVPSRAAPSCPWGAVGVGVEEGVGSRRHSPQTWLQSLVPTLAPGESPNTGCPFLKGKGVRTGEVLQAEEF